MHDITTTVATRSCFIGNCQFDPRGNARCPTPRHAAVGMTDARAGK